MCAGELKVAGYVVLSLTERGARIPRLEQVFVTRLVTQAFLRSLALYSQFLSRLHQHARVW